VQFDFENNGGENWDWNKRRERNWGTEERNKIKKC